MQEYIRLNQRNQDYHPSELILALIYAIMMGLRRINKTEILQYNGAFLEMLGLARFPDQSTLRRFLKRLPPKTIRQLVRLHDSLRAYLFCLPTERTTLVFDLDSYVITIYGKQQGASVGYHPKKHRFVVVRRPIPEDPQEARQLTLFKDTKYVYHVFVTNLTISPWRVYLFYRPRAAVKKNIRELLYDYPLGKIPTDSWTANVAFFQSLLFAAGIVHWFKRLCLPKEYLHSTLDTIRTDFVVLPARWVRTGRQNTVK